MIELVDLPGMTEYRVQAVYIQTFEEARAAILAGKSCTAEGDNGAIAIYRDDSDMIRCIVMWRLLVIDEKAYKNIEQAQKWIEDWLNKIE